MKTIAGIVTYPINQTIGIIRLSGSDAFNIINNVCSNEITKKGHEIQYTKIIDKKNNNKIIDSVLILKFLKPKSFTGEDVVEINCHGNMIVVNNIVNLLCENGAVLAQRGEFTKQAFLNNKLNLVQAQSINNLIKSNSQSLVDYSLEKINNSNTKEIDSIINELFFICGNCEVSIDYPEYDDVYKWNNNQMIVILKDNIARLKKIVYNYDNHLYLFNGINVLIIGKPNSGKSSLMNCLCECERAIVSEDAGTTRDYISSNITINDLSFNIIDTAGIRNEATNKVEKIGIEKTYDLIEKSDLILFLIDQNVKQDDEWLDFFENINHKKILIKNKSDLSDLNSKIKADISISAKKNINVDLLKQKMTDMFAINDNLSDNLLICSQHEKNIILNAINNLESAIDLLLEDKPIEVILFYIENAYKLISTLTGKEKNLDLIDKIFENFCLGK